MRAPGRHRGGVVARRWPVSPPAGRCTCGCSWGRQWSLLARGRGARPATGAGRGGSSAPSWPGSWQRACRSLWVAALDPARVAVPDGDAPDPPAAAPSRRAAMLRRGGRGAGRLPRARPRWRCSWLLAAWGWPSWARGARPPTRRRPAGDVDARRRSRGRPSSAIPRRLSTWSRRFPYLVVVAGGPWSRVLAGADRRDGVPRARLAAGAAPGRRGGGGQPAAPSCGSCSDRRRPAAQHGAPRRLPGVHGAPDARPMVRSLLTWWPGYLLVHARRALPGRRAGPPTERGVGTHVEGRNTWPTACDIRGQIEADVRPGDAALGGRGPGHAARGFEAWLGPATLLAGASARSASTSGGPMGERTAGAVDVVLMTPPRQIVFNPAHDASVIRSSGAYPPLGLASVAGAVEADGARTVHPRPGRPARCRAMRSGADFARLRPSVVGIGGMTLSLPSIGRLRGADSRGAPRGHGRAWAAPAWRTTRGRCSSAWPARTSASWVRARRRSARSSAAAGQASDAHRDPGHRLPRATARSCWPRRARSSTISTRCRAPPTTSSTTAATRPVISRGRGLRHPVHEPRLPLRLPLLPSPGLAAPRALSQPRARGRRHGPPGGRPRGARDQVLRRDLHPRPAPRARDLPADAGSAGSRCPGRSARARSCSTPR